MFSIHEIDPRWNDLSVFKLCPSYVQSIMLLSTLYYFFASSLHFLNKNILLRYPLSECSSNFQPWESNKVPQKNKVLFLNYFFDSWNRKSWNRNSWNRTRDGDCDVANRVWQQYPVDNGMFWCSHSNDPSETGQQKRGGPSGFQATSKWKSLHGHDPCTKGETFLKTVVSIYLFCVHFFLVFIHWCIRTC